MYMLTSIAEKFAPDKSLNGAAIRKPTGPTLYILLKL
jgi:hypothetical protein